MAQEMTDERRRELLADLMEHILTMTTDGWYQYYVDAESGVMDVRFSPRPEWTAAIDATRHASRSGASAHQRM